MKKFLSILLAVSILSSISMPAFAASNAPSREEYNDLVAAVRAAKTDEDAIIAMDNLLNFYERVDNLQFSNGYMYSTLKIWNSQNAYRNNEEYLYSGTTESRLPSFP